MAGTIISGRLASIQVGWLILLSAGVGWDIMG